MYSLSNYTIFDDLSEIQGHSLLHAFFTVINIWLHGTQQDFN